MSLISSVFKQLSDRFSVWNRPKGPGQQRKSGVVQKRKRFRNKLSFNSTIKNRPLRWLLTLLFWFFGLMMVYSAGLKYIEDYDWSEAIWQGWQTFTTVGYGNAPPETVWGRVYTIILSTVGIAIVGAVFSAAFDYSHYLSELKRSGLMKNPHKDGYVIFNFPDTQQLHNFISELRVVEPNVGICMVDSILEELPKSIAVLPHVHFIKGSTLDESTYEKANINNNKAVIVFPQNPTMSDSDGATKTTVDLIERFASDQTRIIHILVDPKNNWMFKSNRSTSILEGFELFAIIQECQDPHSAQIIEELLLNTEGANPKTLIPKLTVGWTWGDLMQRGIPLAIQQKLVFTPLAMVKKGEIMTSPDYLERINEDTLLSILTHNGFDWPAFEKQLVISKNNAHE